MRAGDAHGARSACENALRQFPGDANLLVLCAKANIVLQRYDEARKTLDEAIKLHPDFAIAHDAYGDMLFAQGYADTAIKAYEQALRLDPTRAHLTSKIGKARELKEAAKNAPKVREEKHPVGRKMPREADIRRAQELQRAGNHQEAEVVIRDILKRDPDHVEAARLLAAIAFDNKRYRDAEVFLRHATSIAPDYGRLWVDLTNVMRERHKLHEALECAEKVLELAPDRPEPHMLYASAIGSLGNHEEAIRSYQKALEIAPDRVAAMCSMAHHLKTIGRQDECIAMYRQCIATKHDHSEAYWSLANLKTFRFEPAELAAMQQLLEDQDLADGARLEIHNALGLDSEARKEYDNAFPHFEQCNQIRRKTESYDPVENETGVDQIISTFDAEFLEKNEGNGSQDASPIFVVGLPRSGSTLIEQILASHSQVDGTFELGDLTRVVQKLQQAAGRKFRFTDALGNLPPDDWRGIGEDYIESTRKYRGEAPRFIDKNPNNFIYAGLLRIALPNAKIINAKRHPLDSCFGTFKQLFASGQPFSYDLTELGEYYLQYLRVMDHWHQVAPGFVLDVQYEDVVADLETQVRRILEFCDLPFEPACLTFYETERAVKTASSEQVRQPIYSSSVNLWRNYEKHLGELFHIMEPILQRMPEAEWPEELRQKLHASTNY